MRVIWEDDKVESLLNDIKEDIVEDGCKIVLETAKKSMKKGSFRPWPSQLGGIHYSSNPETPPAPDTTVLKESISYITSSGDKGGGENTVSQPIYGKNTGIVAGRVGTTEEMGIRHELGRTWKEVKRPWLRTALVASKGRITRMFSKHKNRI